MWGPDQASQIIPWLNVAARQWHAGTLPLWDPHMWGGQPLLGQAQPGVAYFLNWLLYSMPMKNGVFSSDVLHWYMAVIHFMAAVFCYALCRDLGRSVPASMIAGLTYSLTSYMSTTSWPQMLNGAVWAPLVFFFLIRAIEKRNPLRSAALSGLCLGLAWLSGHHQVPLLLSLASGVTWLVYAFKGRRIDTGILRCAVIAFAICGLIGALQILPAREYGIHSAPLGNRWRASRLGREGSLLGPRKPVDDTDLISRHRVSACRTISEPFVGFAAFALAVLAVLTRWRDPRVRLFAFLGIGGFLYALGANTGMEGIAYTLVPMMEKARTPGAAIFLFGFAAAVLTGYGLDILGRRVTLPHLRRAARILLAQGSLFSPRCSCSSVQRSGPTRARRWPPSMRCWRRRFPGGAFPGNSLPPRCTILRPANVLEASSVSIAGGQSKPDSWMTSMRSTPIATPASTFTGSNPRSESTLPAKVYLGTGPPTTTWMAWAGTWRAQRQYRTVAMYNRNFQLLWGAGTPWQTA